MVFDDFSHVFENRAIRYLWHPRVFFESEHTRSRPLPYLTFAISYAFHGLSLSWLRIWSVAIHLGSAFLVGLLFLRWFRELPWGALLAVMIFLLHPLAADSVIYFSARGSLLVLFFLLLALWAHGCATRGWASWLCFLFASVAAFLSRETAVALFPVLFLLHRMRGLTWKSFFPYALPFLMGGVALLWIKAGFLDSAFRGIFTVQGDIEISGPLDYLRLSLSLWPGILKLFVSPLSLSIDHQLVLPGSWLDLTVIVGVLIWLIFAFSLFLAWRTRSYAWLAPTWFFLSLLPTNSFFPLLDPFSERHFYLALPGFAWGLAWLITRLSPKGEANIAVPALVLVFLLSSFFTLPRILTWESPTRLWLDAHRKAPSKFRVAYNGAVSLILSSDDNQAALSLLGETLALLKPGDLSFERQEEGLQTAAAALVFLASQKRKNESELLANFPSGYWRELLLLRATIDREPMVWNRAWKDALSRVNDFPLSPAARDREWVRNTFWLLKAEHLARKGKNKEAVLAYESVFLSFSERHFPYWTAREALGDLYMALGRENEAIEQFELAAYQYKVFKRFPFLLHRKLYALYLNKGDTPRATDAVGELIRVYTDNVQLRRLYADLLLAGKDRHAARQSKEADFYDKNAVAAMDEREFLRP